MNLAENQQPEQQMLAMAAMTHVIDLSCNLLHVASRATIYKVLCYFLETHHNRIDMGLCFENIFHGARPKR